MSIKRIAIVFFVVGATVFLSGCGANKAENKSQNNPKSQDASSNKNISTEKLPQATGKVDDTVNAIVDGANKEGESAISDDNDAKSATASNSQAVDEVGQGL